MEAAISKAKGIDRLVKGYSPGKVEEEKNIKENLTWRKYKDALQMKDFGDFLKGCIDEVLTPRQINGYIHVVGSNLKDYQEGTVAGCFISRLVQKSYDAGNKDFSLRNPHPELNNLCSFLKGDMCIEVYGHAGMDFAAGSKGCTFTINCSSRAIGHMAQNCTFIINEKISRVDQGRRCTYKTSLRDMLELLVSWVSKTDYVLDYDATTRRTICRPSYNKIIFIHGDGQEEIVRNYAAGSVRRSSVRLG